MYQSKNDPLSELFKLIVSVFCILILIILVLSVGCFKSCKSDTHKYKEPLKSKMLIEIKNGISDTTYIYNNR